MRGDTWSVRAVLLGWMANTAISNEVYNCNKVFIDMTHRIDYRVEDYFAGGIEGKISIDVVA